MAAALFYAGRVRRSVVTAGWWLGIVQAKPRDYMLPTR